MLVMNVFTAILFISLSSSLALAEWAEEHMAAFQIINTRADVEIDKEGHAVETHYSEFKVLNEQGRNHLVLQAIPYIPDAQKIEVLSASSVTKGVEEKVDLKKIQDRNATRPEGGITSQRELIIPFNNLQIGSIVKYTIKTTSIKTLVKGFHESNFTFGIYAPELAGSAKIKSEIPLYVTISDPWDVLDLKEFKEDNFYIVEFTQKKPLFKAALDLNPLFRDHNTSWIRVRTMKDWGSFTKPIYEKYEKVLSAKTLPPQYKNIIEKAKKAKTLEDKIDIVTSELAQIMTYSGNWVSFENMYIPTNLAEVALLNTGDCKDFSLATTVMLRHLGITANIALTNRKAPTKQGVIQYSSSDLSYPSQRYFNHAIVKVTDGRKVLWIDPTNIVSDAGYVFSDIAGSPALELSKTTSYLETIPYAQASQSVISFTKEIGFLPDDSAEVHTSFTLTGEFSKGILEASLLKGEEEGRKIMNVFLKNSSKNQKSFYDGINFKNRISKSLQGKQKSLGENLIYESEKKKFLTLEPLIAPSPLFYSGSRRVVDFGMPSALKEETKTVYKGIDFIDFPNDCLVVTPWFEAKRSFFKTQEGFEVHQSSIIKRNEISLDEVKSDKFQMFVSDILECNKDYSIEIRSMQPKESLVERMKEYSLENAQKHFDKQGPESINGAQVALHMTEQLLKKTPENKELLILKARALRRVGYKHEDVDLSEYYDLSDAIINPLAEKHPKDTAIWHQKVWSAYFRKDRGKIIEHFNHLYSISPKDFELYKVGGFVAERLYNLAAAKASYQKALSLAQKDTDRASVSVGIAEIAITQKNFDEAIINYRQAIKYAPENYWIQGNFMAFLNRQRRWDEAIEVGESFIQKSAYGIAKRTLSRAYKGKAAAIYDKALQEDPTRKSESFKKKFSEAEENLMRGLKHHSGCESCLHFLGRLYHEKAKITHNTEDIYKSLSYYEKAKEAAQREGYSLAEREITELKQIIAGKTQPDKQRLPSSKPGSN